MSPIKKENHKLLQCGTHGAVSWKGHVVCHACGALYQTSDEAGAAYAPDQCTCGLRLMPKGKKKFSARSVCESCFNERRTKH